jgi:hypothetical protein
MFPWRPVSPGDPIFPWLPIEKTPWLPMGDEANNPPTCHVVRQREVVLSLCAQRCADRKVETMGKNYDGYMMIGHHTIVTMQVQPSGMYRIATYRITPQRNDETVEQMVNSNWSEFVRCQYADGLCDATVAFAKVCASELNDEASCQAQLEAQAA